MNLVPKVWFSRTQNPFHGLKNSLFIRKGQQSQDGCQYQPKRHAKFHTNQIAILDTALQLLKTSSFLSVIQVIITNCDTNCDNLRNVAPLRSFPNVGRKKWQKEKVMIFHHPTSIYHRFIMFAFKCIFESEISWPIRYQGCAVQQGF